MPPDYSPITHIPSTEPPPIEVPVPLTEVSPPPPRHHIWRNILLTIIILLILAGGGLTSYAYWKKLGPFSEPPYAPENLLAGLADSFSKLNSVSYHTSLEVKTEAREADVQPSIFNLGTSSSFVDKLPIPADFRLASEASGLFNRQTINWKTSDTKSQIKAELAGDDFSFNLDLEWIKKGLDFYFRINKFPTFFFFDLSTIKGVWVKITPEDLAGNNWRISFLQSAPDINEELKKNQEKVTAQAEKVLQIAKEEKIITATVAKPREKIGDKIAWRYDLAINLDALTKFYERLLLEFPTLDLSELDFLKNPPKDKNVLIYFANNSRLSIWLEEHSGFVLSATYHLRFVPPIGTIPQFENKQIGLTWSLELTEHNQLAMVTPPSNFKTVKEVLEELFPDPLKSEANQRIIAAMSDLQAEAELKADIKGLYPKTLCATLNQKILESASITLICLQSSNRSTWAAHTVLEDGTGNFCVDSSGLASSSPIIHAAGGGAKAAICQP